jgi:hypothetical protein
VDSSPGVLLDEQKPDLVLYFSYPLEEFPEVVATLRRAWKDARWRHCFADMRLISAGLNATADRYLPGRRTQQTEENTNTTLPEEDKRPAPSGKLPRHKRDDDR